MEHRITPFLWFDGQAEEAARFYVSVFKNSKLHNVSGNGDGGAASSGPVRSVSFELDGQPFVAFDGGPEFKFTEAVSFFVSCTSQAEVDDLWDKLVAGGTPQACGWLKDKYGLSWQIIPDTLMRMLGDPDPRKSASVMQAMFKMQKIDVAALEEAYAQG